MSSGNTQSVFATTILAARKLNEGGSTPWAVHVAISDAIEKANRILEKIDERWPSKPSATGCENGELAR